MMRRFRFNVSLMQANKMIKSSTQFVSIILGHAFSYGRRCEASFRLYYIHADKTL